LNGSRDAAALIAELEPDFLADAAFLRDQLRTRLG